MAAQAFYKGCRVDMAICLSHPPGPQVSLAPLLGPWSRYWASAKCLHIPCISLVSVQLLQGLSSCVDLFLIVPEIHPEAFGTTHRAPVEQPAQTPSPHQPGPLGPRPRQLQSWLLPQTQQLGGREAQGPTHPKVLLGEKQTPGSNNQQLL